MSVQATVTRDGATLRPWIAYTAIGVFLMYAANFLYFFVDDEGIPFVYAQQLLNGHGLVYSSVSDGRVEGYSDFLHVLVSTGVLSLVRAMNWPKITVFFIGKGIGLAAGMATIGVVFVTLRRLTAVTFSGAVAGLGFLSLAGPLAVWSCSSLETVPFVFLVAVLAFGLLSGLTSEPTGRFDILAAAAATLIVLERIDGPLYVTALVGSFLLSSDRGRRIDLLWRVVLPTLCIGAGYHAWRVWYFKSVFPTPLYAKVLFKLRPHAQLVTKLPPQSYAIRFIDTYGKVAVAAASIAVIYAAWHHRAARALVVAGGVMAVYAAMVSDWMFGFRFFTPLLPLVAVLITLSVSLCSRKRSQIAWIATTVVVIWCGVSALAFERQYEYEEAPGWWRKPSLDQARFFGKYRGADVLDAARKIMLPRTLVAYNQAGFVPFMLDLHNIDNLGICNRFYSELPSTDVYFTEVGRYTPLTDSPSIRAGEAYLLYRDVPFILAGYNSGLAPDQLFGGFYQKIETIQGEGLYARTRRSTAAYRSDPTLFFENLAHVSSLRDVRINGQLLEGAAIKAALPFLRDEYGWADLKDGAFVLEAQLANVDATVYEIDINGIIAATPASIAVELISSSGSRQVTRFKTEGGESTERFFQHVDGAPASRLRLTISGNDDHVWLRDIRLQGQSAALAKYIRQSLTFAPLPAPEETALAPGVQTHVP